MTDLLYPFIQLMPNARSPSANAQLPMTNYQSNLYWIRYEILHPLIYLKISKGTLPGSAGSFSRTAAGNQASIERGKRNWICQYHLIRELLSGKQQLLHDDMRPPSGFTQAGDYMVQSPMLRVNRMDLDIATRARERWHNFHAPSRLLRSPVY